MERQATSFVLGYHGCDRAVAERLLQGADFKPSENDYDWLGSGIYFWEANPQRGLDFARELRELGRGKVTDPAVVGAVIDLGACLDLASLEGIKLVQGTYPELQETLESAGESLPTNGPSLLLRRLDCAVINMLHEIREQTGQPRVDTVRGVFVEGEPIYPGAGIHEKTHTQIAVCNPDCIRGVFRVQPRFLN